MRTITLTALSAAILAVGACASASAQPPTQPSATTSPGDCARVSSAFPGSVLGLAVPGQVETVRERQFFGKAYTYRTSGVRLFIPAKAGLTAEHLQRAAQCEIEQHAATGYASAHDPFAVPGARAEVTSAGNGYYLTIRTKDAAQARELVERTQQR